MKVKKLLMVATAVIAFIGIGSLTSATTVKADPSRPQNVYYDYATTATVCGEWGANLFMGNDQGKGRMDVLPVGSQWQVFGYTWRDDGYYYYAGGDLWIQGNEVKIPANDKYSAILNVVTRYGEDLREGYHWQTYYIGDPMDGPAFLRNGTSVVATDGTFHPSGTALLRSYGVSTNGDVIDYSRYTW